MAHARLRGGANGLLLLFSNPRELPLSIFLLIRYVWNVRLRGKALLVLVREGGVGDLASVLASVPGLRQRHPSSWLVLITPIGCRELAVSAGLADAVLGHSRSAELAGTVLAIDSMADIAMLMRHGSPPESARMAAS